MRKPLLVLSFIFLWAISAFAQSTIPMPVTDTANWNDAISGLLNGIQGKSYMVIAFAIVQILVLTSKVYGWHKKLGKYGSLITNAILSAVFSVLGLIVGGMDWMSAIMLFLSGPSFGKLVNDMEGASNKRKTPPAPPTPPAPAPKSRVKKSG